MMTPAPLTLFRRVVVLCATGLVLAACSSNKNIDPPAELTDNTTPAGVCLTTT